MIDLIAVDTVSPADPCLGCGRYLCICIRPTTTTAADGRR